jgi:hypothetical protein
MALNRKLYLKANSLLTFFMSFDENYVLDVIKKEDNKYYFNKKK